MPGAGVWEELTAGRVPATAPQDADEVELLARYGPLVDAGRPLVLAQLGQSLDGFIASRTGDACFVTGEEDRAHLHRLRALVDAVVVGASTVSVDDPQLTVRAVPGPNPVRVILDPNGRVPHDCGLLRAPDAPTLWLVGPDAAPDQCPQGTTPDSCGSHVTRCRLRPDQFSPEGVLAVLTGRGLSRVLVEGGGRTVSRFVAAGVVDRLYVTSAPMLIGDGVPGLRFDGADALRHALTGRVRRFTFGPDICTELDFRR